MKKPGVLLISFVLLSAALLMPVFGAEESTAVLVTKNGEEAASAALLTDWTAGEYTHIKLYGDTSLSLNGEDLVVDLSGNTLTLTGSGKISVFDTANDTYNADACGKLVNNGSVTVADHMTAPNGNTYVAISEEDGITTHRLSIRLSYVTLRTTSAGLYYKATYDCDAVLSQRVDRYGVVVSLKNMPGADFETEPEWGNSNRWTVSNVPFTSGVTVTSGSIFGIMKEDRTAAKNDQYAKMKIYANAYVDFGNGPIVADTENAGKVATGNAFTGTAVSLYDVMQQLDNTYEAYAGDTHLQLDTFYKQWKEKGMDSWEFKIIGTPESVYKMGLVFDEGTTNAVCPVCDKKVTWTALTAEPITLAKDTHYYLVSDVVYAKTGAGYLTGATQAADKGVSCLHLNGHKITATQYRAINFARTTLNIIGMGTVSGNFNTSGIKAATVYSGYSDGALNLYSGTITKNAANTHPTVVQRDGSITLYSGATIENGYDITPTSATAKPVSDIYGGKVTGTTKITGGTMTLTGAPQIERMEIATGIKLNLGELKTGANINVSASGYFTTEHAQAEQYAAYFRSVSTAKPIVIKGNALYCVTDPAEDDTLYILTAAASNSHYFTDELYGVLAAAGVKAKVCNLMKDSTGINAFYDYWKNGEKVFKLIIHDENGKTILENYSLDDALALYNWDIFNMQEGTAPHRQTTPQEGGTATSTPQKVADDRETAHTALVEHLRKTIPQAKLYYQEIWSPDIGFNRFNYQMTTVEQQLAFSASIKEYTDIVCEDFDLDTIPCGQAWIIARENTLCNKLCARLAVNNGEGDYYHDGDIGGGQYLNACVWFETLTGQNCIGNTFRPDYELSEELITVLQQAAHQAVADMNA